MKIVQGDNNIKFPFVVGFEKGLTTLENATVELRLTYAGQLVEKAAEVLDAATGECQVILLKEDLLDFGIYQYQWTVTLEDAEISGEPLEFYVHEKINGVVPVINIIVDGGEVQ